MKTSVRLAGTWGAVAFFILFVVGFHFFADFVPPPPPSYSSDQIAVLFRARSGAIMVGMILLIAGATCYLAWTALLSDLIKEIEGRPGVLYATQLVAGALEAATFMFAGLIWAAAAFRPRSPEITQALVDLGWLVFITPTALFILQYVALAIAILADKREQPAFPRWAAYLQLWISLIFMPAQASYFMKHGPLAFNGMFVWWVPFAVYTGWLGTMVVLARKAVLLEDRRLPPATTVEPDRPKASSS